MHAPLTASSDVTRPMPDSRVAQLDAARHAIASLEHEQRRLARLGFELPLARCHQQLRYWRFVESVLNLRTAGEAR